MKNKVALIIPYFGELPKYFPLFLNSVADKNFDILFFSDCEITSQLPANIKWKTLSFHEACNLFNKKLEIEVNLKNPYKLCDLKPMLGLVFQDYLLNYDFWGSIDIDVVVGNFERFITDEILNEIDFYSGVKEYVSGSFFLIRNSIYFNDFFKKSKDWVKVLTTEKYLGFDECGGHFFEQLKAGGNIFEIPTDVQSFTELIFLGQKNGLRALFTDDILETKGFDYVSIEPSGIKYAGREYLLLHFIYFKARYYFKIYPYINTHLYYINSLGNFKRKPTLLRVIFSKNLLDGILKKIQINLRKLKP